MSEETITIKIKMTSNAKVYSITVNKACTVEELKQACEKETTIPVQCQNLVFKGRILENTKKIDEYNVQNDNTIILVKKVSPQEKKKMNHQNKKIKIKIKLKILIPVLITIIQIILIIII